MNPLVSIIIPAYNSAQYIAETIDACLQQSYTAIEIIVVDDGSTDDTVSIVESYDDKVRLIQQDNSGPAIARNTGIEAANGNYIQFCDSDDILHPQKIEKCMALLLKHDDVALAYCQMQIVDERLQPIGHESPVPQNDFFENGTLFCKIFHANGSPIQTSTILARKSALMNVGKYRADPDHLCAEDWDLLLRLATKYNFIGLQEVLVSYRRREDALTTKPLLMAAGRLKTLQYARDYSARTECMTDADYNALLAGRYHVFAIALWADKQNALARQAFHKAADLSPTGRLLRRLHANLTYLFPVQVAHWMQSMVKARG